MVSRPGAAHRRRHSILTFAAPTLQNPGLIVEMWRSAGSPASRSGKTGHLVPRSFTMGIIGNSLIVPTIKTAVADATVLPPEQPQPPPATDVPAAPVPVEEGPAAPAGEPLSPVPPLPTEPLPSTVSLDALMALIQQIHLPDGSTDAALDQIHHMSQQEEPVDIIAGARADHEYPPPSPAQPPVEQPAPPPAAAPSQAGPPLADHVAKHVRAVQDMEGQTLPYLDEKFSRALKLSGSPASQEMTAIERIVDKKQG